MDQIREMFANSTIPARTLISGAFLILGEIMILLSLALITEFNSALHDYGEESADYYINPNFFRSKAGLLSLIFILSLYISINYK